MCAFLQCFSFLSPLCSCVGQSLFGLIKIVFVIAFFLIKTVLRHDHKKRKKKKKLLLVGRRQREQVHEYRFPNGRC